MKSNIYKTIAVIAVLSTLALQASCPPLPDVTSIKVNGFGGEYYAVQLIIRGNAYPYLTDETDYTEDVFSPSGTVYFRSNHQFCHNSAWNTFVHVALLVKVYSNSPWACVGSIDSNSQYFSCSLSGNYLYYGECNVGNMLFAEDAPVEE
jgi:hypothetical protein